MGRVDVVFICILTNGGSSCTRYDPRAHLSYGDVRVDSVSNLPWMEAMVVSSSQNAMFGRGVTLSVGVSGSDVCPVTAMVGYLVQRGSVLGPLFRFADGRMLTRKWFIAAVGRALVGAGIDPSRYAGHSFRVGVATTAALRGLQDSLIKTLGRWESSAYMNPQVHTGVCLPVADSTVTGDSRRGELTHAMELRVRPTVVQFWDMPGS